MYSVHYEELIPEKNKGKVVGVERIQKPHLITISIYQHMLHTHCSNLWNRLPSKLDWAQSGVVCVCVCA